MISYHYTHARNAEAIYDALLKKIEWIPQQNFEMELFGYPSKLKTSLCKEIMMMYISHVETEDLEIVFGVKWAGLDKVKCYAIYMSARSEKAAEDWLMDIMLYLN
jgi:uncharacterized protein (UPF0248 family)